MILGFKLLAAPPVGDAFETALELPADAVHSPSSPHPAWPQYPSFPIPHFAEATSEINEQLIDGVSGVHSVWFTWRATNNSHVLFSGAMAPGTQAPLLAVYTGDRLQALQLVSSNAPLNRLDSTLNPRFRVVEFQAKAGIVYHLRMDSAASLPTNTWTAIGLYLPASNDAFASRTLVPFSGADATFESRLIAGTIEPDEPVVRAGTVARTSAWFEFILPESGAYQATTEGDADIAVFQGDSIGSLERRSWSVEAKGTTRGSVIRDERFRGNKGERFILAVSDEYVLAGTSHGAIHRVPLYDAVEPPKIRIGNQLVGPPKLTFPSIRRALLVEGRANRLYDIQTSSDLNTWRHWQWHVPTELHSTIDLENGTAPEPFLRAIAPD